VPFSVHTAGDAMVVKLTPQALNDPTAEAAGARLLGLADGPCRQLRLDLGELPYLSSEWLNRFVALHNKVRSRGGHLAVVNVPARVYEVFRLTGLDTVLDVRPQGAG
jgi:anti-anti-sigma factor